MIGFCGDSNEVGGKKYILRDSLGLDDLNGGKTSSWGEKFDGIIDRCLYIGIEELLDFKNIVSAIYVCSPLKNHYDFPLTPALPNRKIELADPANHYAYSMLMNLEEQLFMRIESPNQSSKEETVKKIINHFK